MSFDNSDLDFKEILAQKRAEYAPLQFTDAVEMLHVMVPEITLGQTKLYDWQKETLKFLCSPGVFTKDNPLQFILCACNGSGKDAYVLAPFAVWHALCKPRSRCIITSSSFNQLKNQTEPSIRSIAQSINAILNENVMLVKQFHIICTLTNSEILMFATDDPGLAEGYHPFPDYPGAEMAIVVNESKTVNEGIFGALRRCNGYNRWVEVSSPGILTGHMYDMWRRSKKYPDRYVPTEDKWFSRRVTAYDCPHISRSIIEDDKMTFGESSPQFRSMYLAEFTDLTENAIVPAEMLAKCTSIRREHRKISLGATAGIDLSFGGGDETVGYCIDGNRIMDSFAFKGLTDTVALKDRVKMYLESWHKQFALSYENVSIDDGNAGRSIVDMLHLENMPVRRVINQSRAINNKQFANRGAELYWNVRRLVEECILDIDMQKHSKLLDQLRGRRYRQHAIAGTLVCEPKSEARARGGSPDHADAFVLACSQFTIREFEEGQPDEVAKPNGKPRFTMQDIGKMEDLLNFGEETPWLTKVGQASKKIYGSLSTAMAVANEAFNKGKI